MKTQCDDVLNCLKGGCSITQWEALMEYGIGRLAARINDVKNRGHKISTDMIKVKARNGRVACVAAYRL